MEINSFIIDDCEQAMKRLPNDSISLVLTSPPYADQRSYGTSSGRINPDNYVDWFIPKAHEIYRILKPNGSFVLNINDKIVGHYQHLYVFRLLIALCDIVGFHLVRDYIWYNPATPPNIFSQGNKGRTKKSHEYCFWFSKSDDWYFNLDAIRTPYGKAMEKYLAGKGKGNRTANTRPSTHSFNCEKVWNDKGGADPGSVIQISNTASNDLLMKLCKEKGIKHPARFPLKLAEFFINAGSQVGDVILDPFGGSGTTIVASAKLKRNWIYIDSNDDYYVPVHAMEKIMQSKEVVSQHNCSECRYDTCSSLNKEIMTLLNCNEATAELIISLCLPAISINNIEIDDEMGLAKYSYVLDHDFRDARMSIATELFDPSYESLVNDELREILWTSLDELTAREARVINHRYGLEGSTRTLEEIGMSLHITRERVRQIQMKGERKLSQSRTLRDWLGITSKDVSKRKRENGSNQRQ